MAPELWRGAAADERSDIYALGVTLYYLLTGTTPFEASTTMEKMAAHLERAPGWPTSPMTVPPQIEEIVLRCLAKRPEDRYHSARDLYLALDSARDPLEWTPDHARAFWERTEWK
jgi:eukaryotic-like serine/threonine-protein kinase